MIIDRDLKTVEQVRILLNLPATANIIIQTFDYSHATQNACKVITILNLPYDWDNFINKIISLNVQKSTVSTNSKGGVTWTIHYYSMERDSFWSKEEIEEYYKKY